MEVQKTVNRSLGLILIQLLIFMTQEAEPSSASDVSTYIRKGYPNPSNHQLETGNGETSFLGRVAL